MARAPLQLPTFNAMEREIFILNATWELANRTVNRSMLRLHYNDPNSEVRFNTNEGARLFNIWLVDMLSRPSRQFSGDNDYVAALVGICDTPSFGPKYAIRPLRTAARRFHRWLNTRRIYRRVWLPAIDRNCSIEMRRYEFLKICGNISKHNYTRLSDAAQKLREILARTGIQITSTQSLLLLNEFDDWFHDHIFHYHSSTIAEFINNIRIGIFHYLLPEFDRSYTPDQDRPPRYSFKRPAAVQNDYAFEVYWELMNRVRGRPLLPTFTITQALKRQY